MKTNRAAPPVTVVPVLPYPDVPAAAAWLSAAFGFVERTRIGERHRIQMSVGDDGAVIVAERRGGEKAPPGAVSYDVRVRVEDPAQVVATSWRRTISAIQTGANGDVQPGDVG